MLTHNYPTQNFRCTYIGNCIDLDLDIETRKRYHISIRKLAQCWDNLSRIYLRCGLFTASAIPGNRKKNALMYEIFMS